MNRLGTGSARLLVFATLVGSLTGMASGCATNAQSAPPTATAEAELPATPSPTSVPTAQPKVKTYTVGNTNGLGVYLRRSAGGPDKIKAWPDGTVMTVIGGDQIVNGTTWKNVRDPDGNEGWMVADYLVP